MKKIIILAATAFLLQKASAQTTEEVKAVFPNEEAVFLNYNTNIKIFLKEGIPVAETQHDQAMMVLSEKNANMYSNYSVHHSGYRELKKMEAYTTIPGSNKKYAITERKTANSTDGSVFYDDSKETSFDYTSLTQNAVTHLEYTLFHKDAHLISPLLFGSGAAVLSASFSVTFPSEIGIKYLVKNDAENQFKFSTEKKKGQTIYTWTLTNFKNKSSYGDAPDFMYFMPHIIIFVTNYKNDAGTDVPFLGSLNDLYNWNVSFTKELNKTEDENLKKIVDSVITGKKTEIEKTEAIYQWVQKNIKYVAFEDGLEGFRPRQAAEVCTKRYGDCKDMSSIITNMLRIAGIKAYYTWIGTRSIPYDYNDVHSPITDNHMISTALINNQWYFLDGTSPNSKLDLPPSAIQNKEALIGLSESEYKVLRVPTATAEKNTIVDSTFISFTDNGVKGTEKVNYSGYFGEQLYNSLLYRDEKGKKDLVKSRTGKGSNKFMLGEYTINNTNPKTNLINITANYEIPDYGKKLGNEYYINLNLEKLLENQVIDTAKRKVSKEFDFLYTIKQFHILEIPKGYIVSYKPNDFSIDNELVSSSIIYTQKDNKLIAEQKVTNKLLMLNTSDFDKWNKTMKQIQSQYKEQVVLEKK